MNLAVLIGADLQGAQLQGVNLWIAQLQGVNLWIAQLQGANLWIAQLQGAVLSGAQLQGAVLSGAQLQGAVLWGAQLQDANLWGAQLQGADLGQAQLQGANLWMAQLQGANLRQAQLQGANLRQAQLQGANLKDATFYQNGGPGRSDLLDIRGTVVKSLSPEEFSAIQTTLESISFDDKQGSLQRLKQATEPGSAVPTFASCIADQESQPKCQQTYAATNPEQQREFMVRLHEALATLACKDAYTAQGILGQILSSSNNDHSKGLATVLLARMKTSEPCPGLAGLPAEYKAELERLTKEEEAEHQQAAKAASAVR